MHILFDSLMFHCGLRIFSAMLLTPVKEVVSVGQTRRHSPNPTSTAVQSGRGIPFSLFKCPFGNFNIFSGKALDCGLCSFEKHLKLS